MRGTLGCASAWMATVVFAAADPSHHYHLRLYALKVAKLELPVDASAARVAFNVHAQALGSAELTGIYGR